MKKVFHVFIAICMITNSASGQTLQVELKSRTILEGVHSASGVEFVENKFLIIGDNSKWLYELNSKLKIKNQFAILNTSDISNDTIPKKIKPDFEASCIVETGEKKELYIFGSGSLSPNRDTLVKVDLENLGAFKNLSISDFYLTLQKALSSELNIEGALFYQQKIILLNRADNAMISIPLDNFENFIQGKTTHCDFSIFKFELPIYKNVPANFSGACLIPETNKILFTASLEATENWIDDGDVLGSYIGVIELNDSGLPKLSAICPIMENNEYCRVKVESIVVTKMTKNQLNVAVVTDSDGGNSELIELNITGY